uniref:Uncharacterized protein n=1 Tax=Romanomermis culicivorax TaxID=13658 RepID=A0A915JER7_ROMCU
VDGKVIVFDIGQGQALTDSFAVHNDQPVYGLAFSRGNGILASGGADDKIAVHNLSNFASEMETIAHSKISSKPSDVSLGDYYTKSTSVLHLSFTRRNLLLGAGNFDQ